MELAYFSSFLLPKGRNGDHPRARFGYGAQSLEWNPTTKRIIADSHPYLGWISEFDPNSVVWIDRHDVSGWNELILAEHGSEFKDPASKFRFGDTDPQRVYSEGLPLAGLGGFCLRGDYLYWNYHHTYPVSPAQTDVPTHGKSIYPLTGDPKNEFGLWKIGGFHQKWTAEYMTVAPNGMIATGRGWGAGSAGNSHGPSLFVFDPEDPSVAQKVLFHDDENPFPDWTPSDRWFDIIWTNEFLMFCGRKADPHTWYGKPNAPDARPSWYPEEEWELILSSNKVWPYPDNCDTGKGYHSVAYRPVVAFYNPKTFEFIKLQNLEEDFFNKCGAIGGMCFDKESGHIFIIESNREDPICHVYNLDGVDSGSDKTPPDNNDNLIDISIHIGEQKWKGSVFKDE